MGLDAAPVLRGRRIGYARVSTEDQSLALQLDALRAAGCGRIFHDDGISGSVVHRPALDDALATLEPGDVLVVWKLDRLGRSLAHLIEITLWAIFYLVAGVMPDFATASYFSAVTYATIGYGDVVPPEGWRLLAAMEGLAGILMCAWSGGSIFAIVSRLQNVANPDE